MLFEDYIQHFIQTLADSDEGIFIINIAQEGLPYKFVNKSFSNISGYPITEILGQSFLFSFAREANNDVTNQILGCIKKKEKKTFELRSYKKDGSTYWNRFSLTPVYDPNNEIKYYFGIARDITNYKNLLITQSENNAMRATLETVNDIIYNYLNWIQIFRLDLEEKNNIDLKLLYHFDQQYNDILTRLRKVNLLDKFQTIKVSSNLTILDIDETIKDINDKKD